VTGAPAIRETATASVADSLGSLHSSPAGLTSDEARARAAKRGENAVLRAGGGPLRVFLSQLASPLVLLLAGTAVVSLVLGQSTDAIIILVIVGMSVGFGFFNEFRSLQLVADLDRRLRRTATALRDGVPVVIDAGTLVPGDVIVLRLGDIVPADVRLISAQGFECDEAALTGEAMPVARRSTCRRAPGGRSSFRRVRSTARSFAPERRWASSCAPVGIPNSARSQRTSGRTFPKPRFKKACARSSRCSCASRPSWSHSSSASTRCCTIIFSRPHSSRLRLR